jgi:hypothetical protein
VTKAESDISKASDDAQKYIKEVTDKINSQREAASKAGVAKSDVDNIGKERLDAINATGLNNLKNIVMAIRGATQEAKEAAAEVTQQINTVVRKSVILNQAEHEKNSEKFNKSLFFITTLPNELNVFLSLPIIHFPINAYSIIYSFVIQKIEWAL